MLSFDAVKHEYRNDGRVVPYVTGILPPAEFHVTPEQLEAARAEGENNHSLVKMFNDTGDTLGDPFLETYARFLEEAKSAFGELVLYETPLYSKKYGYAGTPDMVFESAVVDLKRTSGDVKRTALQLAGYSLLAVENKIIQKTKNWKELVITGDDYKLKACYNQHAEDIFIALVKRKQIDIAVENYFKI
jgi:hypothetical protein